MRGHDQKDSALKVTVALLPGAGTEPGTSDFWDGHPGPGWCHCRARAAAELKVSQEDRLSPGSRAPLPPGLGAVIYIARSLEEGLGQAAEQAQVSLDRLGEATGAGPGGAEASKSRASALARTSGLAPIPGDTLRTHRGASSLVPHTSSYLCHSSAV